MLLNIRREQKRSADDIVLRVVGSELGGFVADSRTLVPPVPSDSKPLPRRPS